MWDTIKISLCVITVCFNTYLWIKYYKSTEKINRDKEGWSSYFFVVTILILMVLLNLL